VQRATAQSKNRNFSWFWCSWSSSGFSSRLVWPYVFFLSLSVHFVCSSGDNAAQTFVSLKRWNHETFWENQFTFVFLSAGFIPSQLYRHHYALRSMCRPQVYGRRRRRTKWPILTL
jgi:hypothetical protein